MRRVVMAVWKHRGARIRILMLVGLTAVLAGCGSSGTSNTASSAGSAQSTSSASNGGTTSTTGASSGMKAAEAEVAHYTTFPTKIAVTTPFKKPIPKNEHIVYINCGVATCTDIAHVIGGAAKVLGWQFTQIPSNGTPASVKAAFDTAVRLKPTAVLSSGFNKAEFAPELAQLAAMHIGLFECCNTDPGVGGDRLVNLAGPGDQAQQGQAQAAWATVQTKGKANVLYVNLPDYTILAASKAAFFEYMHQYCPGCAVADLDIPITGIATAANTIVSYLRGHPAVNWVSLSQDALSPGLPAALKAAGLAGKVHFEGQGATALNYQYIKAGQQSASIEFPTFEVFYELVDAVARTVVGQSVAPDQISRSPFHLVTQANVSDASAAIPITKGLVAQYAKLWGR